MLALTASAQVTTGRYWLDNDRSSSRDITLSSGETTVVVDISTLRPGLHILHSRVSDGNLWGSIATSTFLVPDLTDARQELANYRYWIDNDLEHAVTGAIGGDGAVVLDLDVSSLQEGLHVLNARVSSDNGYLSPISSQVFLIPTKEDSDHRFITGYRYWFNKAVPTRVDIDPSEGEVTLKDLIIPIEGVVPNAITPGYTFDVERETVTVIDDVTVGFQAINDDELGLPATIILEDYPVSVNLDVVILKHKQTHDFAVPTPGTICGFRVDEVPLDANVSFTLTAIGATVDFFDGDGNPIEATRNEEDGNSVYRMRPPRGSVYALVHTATEPVAGLTAMWRVALLGDLNDDARVNVGDVNLALSDILNTGGATADYDINGDGKVNVADVNVILNIILRNAEQARRRAEVQEQLE